MQHLALNWRKVLNARIAVLKATARHWPDALKDRVDQEFKLLESYLLLRAKQLGESADEETLQAALAKLSSDLNISAITGKEHDVFEHAFRETCATAAAVRCSQCEPKPLCGSEARIVDQHGSCLDAFRHAWQLAQAESIAWHEHFLPGSLSQVPAAEFSTLLVAKKPDSLGIAQHISGKTKFPDRPDFFSEIELLVQVAEIDLDSYYAAAYILFHELICHAFQSVRRATNSARRTSETDAFSEGWMDWVAYRIFLDVTEDRGWSTVPSRLDPEALEIVSRFRAARMDSEGASQNQRCRAFFRMGEQAARAYHAFLLEQPIFAGDEADEAFFRISFDWNCEGPCQEREEFLDRIRKVLVHKRFPADRAALSAGLDRYLKSKNIKDLVDL